MARDLVRRVETDGTYNDAGREFRHRQVNLQREREGIRETVIFL
jgi:hypothetical protein